MAADVVVVVTAALLTCMDTAVGAVIPEYVVLSADMTSTIPEFSAVAVTPAVGTVPVKDEVVDASKATVAARRAGDAVEVTVAPVFKVTVLPEMSTSPNA